MRKLADPRGHLPRHRDRQPDDRRHRDRGHLQRAGHRIEIYEALTRREGATVVGIASLMVLIYLAASLIVDLLYAVLDPRIRYA
ncbi:hypothetical protein GCM10023238_37780 [Streptomyces heliomycini]